MTHEELIEKVASIISAPTFQYDLHYIVGLNKKTEHIIYTILTALQDPTEDMMKTIGATSVQRLVWQKMLAASPLAGEKRGAE